MPVIKVRENEPFDVALRRFKRSCEKKQVFCLTFAAANSTKSQLLFVNALKRLRKTSHEETGSRKRTS